jgi:hypothetical protein
MKKLTLVLAAILVLVLTTACNKQTPAPAASTSQTPAASTPAASTSQTPAASTPAASTSQTPAASTPAASTQAPAASASSGSGTNWNSLLDQYEKFVDDYVAAMQKAAAGDISAMTNAMSLMEQAESLSGRLANASADLSAVQAARLLQIQTKLTNAATSLF